MNYVSPKNAQQRGHFCETEKSGQVLARLAEGLHAMAQPLTILRGALGAMQLAQEGTPRDRHYVEMSNAQIGRLCDLLTNLRSLLDTAQFQAASEPVDLQKLAERIVADYAATLQDAGVQITLSKRSGYGAVLADPVRTEQAMRAGVDTALALATVGDEICWRMLPNGFVVENKRPHGKGLNSAERLALSVVETAILSQRGTYTAIEDPFSLSIRLPDAEPNVTSEYLKPAV